MIFCKPTKFTGELTAHLWVVRLGKIDTYTIARGASMKIKVTDIESLDGPFLEVMRRRMRSLKKVLSLREFNTEAGLWAAALAALLIAYILQFQIVRDESVVQSIRNSLINIVPAFLLGVSIRLLVRRFVLHLPLIQQIGVHLVLAIGFAHAWYLAILVAASFRLNWLTSGITISPFYTAATEWQLLQGIIVYAALQGLIYGRWLQEQLRQARIERDEALKHAPIASDQSPDSIFVKSGGEFQKIDLVDLIHLEADGDQVKLHTRFGPVTCNRALSSYAEQLEDCDYIRLHRSHLVRGSQIVSAEPTGDGRLSIHLTNGTSIVASRTGTRAFKQYTQQR